LIIWLSATFFLITSERVSATSSAESLTAINAAENDIIQCYTAAKNAEKAGANITDLLITLNEAGTLLSKAHLAHSEGDFDSAIEFANQCKTKLEGFVDSAEDKEKTASHAQYVDFMVNIVGSIVGTVLVILCSSTLWFFLKKRMEKTEMVT